MQQAHRSLAAHFAATFLLVLTAIPTTGRSQDVSITISRVRENVASLHKKLPDFICREEVSIRTTEKGKTTGEKRYLLSLRATRKPDDPANQFSESREVVSATENGKAVDLRAYNPPPWVRGGFARDLFAFFDEPTSGCYDFKPSADSSPDSNTMVLDVSLKENAKSATPDCKHLPGSLHSAKVWIDLKAFQVARIEERTAHEIAFAGPFAHTNGEYTATPVIVYAPVSIHDVEYWLPASKTVDVVKTKGQYAITFTSQLSDYHKFETSATITVVSETN